MSLLGYMVFGIARQVLGESDKASQSVQSTPNLSNVPLRQDAPFGFLTHLPQLRRRSRILGWCSCEWRVHMHTKAQ